MTIYPVRGQTISGTLLAYPDLRLALPECKPLAAPSSFIQTSDWHCQSANHWRHPPPLSRLETGTARVQTIGGTLVLYPNLRLALPECKPLAAPSSLIQT